MRVAIAAVLAVAAGCSKCPDAAPAHPGASAGSSGSVEVGAAPDAVALVRIDGEGRAWIDGTPVASDDELAARVGERARGGSITLAADGRVPHGRVLSVIDRLRAAGVARVAFAVQSSAPPSAVAPAPLETPPPTEPIAETPATPPPEPPPDAAGSLPQVIVETVGLHIGGGPNDASAKAPYLGAIEPQFDAFRACFVKASEPEKGGTFGVDLLIGRNGGKPEVKQPRTGMKGTEFRTCVVEAFQRIEFQKPAKGPTMISYSLRYRLK